MSVTEEKPEPQNPASAAAQNAEPSNPAVHPGAGVADASARDDGGSDSGGPDSGSSDARGPDSGGSDAGGSEAGGSDADRSDTKSSDTDRPDTDGAATGSPDTGSPDTAPGKKKSGWRETILLVAAGVVAALLVRLFVLDSFWIPSESMEDTLLINDRVIVNRLTGDIGRGEVVVFKGWDGTTTIKRVIGVGGDRVKCCDAKGRVSVNGVPLDEGAYLNPQDFPSQDKFDVTVPEGRLWLMGDHRAASEDSRAFKSDKYHGTISADEVIGRAFALYWPLSRIATLPVPETFSKVR
ncbi:signal peptidase I [Sphaerisporangium perillae]|uniref:signal peptidase I n=1 Tax=Sphaerisporangium perillae TaxID=2935860 RepID=UPI00200F32DF|nr:signal peptidase I [Sphaerisporangium perillae]